MLLLATLILSACGGSSGHKGRASWTTLSGAGFHFLAPKGWSARSQPTSAQATRDGELVQVSTFPLVKPYTDALFTKVDRELHARMQALARQTGGAVRGQRTVTAAGIRSHAYDLAVADHVDEYTFVLRGKREYLLLCRRKATGDRSFCEQLVTSFGF